MKRDEFLKRLRNRLNFLSKNEREKVILYYINEIDKSKKSDEEVIKEFGTLENIVKKVCEDHGIEYKKVAKDSMFHSITNFYDNLLEVGTIFKEGDSKKRKNIIIDLLILIVITCVLKIPFLFVRDLGDSLITYLWKSNIILLAIWGLLMEILYVVFALFFFMKTLKKWINNLK